MDTDCDKYMTVVVLLLTALDHVHRRQVLSTTNRRPYRVFISVGDGGRVVAILSRLEF